MKIAFVHKLDINATTFSYSTIQQTQFEITQNTTCTILHIYNISV